MIEYAFGTITALLLGALIRFRMSYTEDQIRKDCNLLREATACANLSPDPERVSDIRHDSKWRFTTFLVPQYGLYPSQRAVLRSIVGHYEIQKVLREEGLDQ